MIQQIKNWMALAPGACSLLIKEHYNGFPKATQREFDKILQKDIAPLQSDWIWFPVTLSPWPEGYLIAVRVYNQKLEHPLQPVAADRIHKAVQWLSHLGINLPMPALCWEHFAEHQQIEGDSCDLAIALAIVLNALGHRPPQPIIVSATTPIDSICLGPVDSIPQKQRIIQTEAPQQQAFLLDQEQTNPLIYLQSLFPADWRSRLAVDSPYAQVQQAWSAYEKGDYAEANRMVKLALLEQLEGRALLRATWLQGACILHLAQSEEAFQNLEGAHRLLRQLPDEDDPAPSWEMEELLAYLLISALDRGHPDYLSPDLENALTRLEQAPNKDRRWREVYLQVAGTLHRLKVLSGDLDAAEKLLTNSIRYPIRSERARSLGDLAEVYRRQGNLEKARDTLQQARTYLNDTPAEQRKRTSRFLHLYAMRCGLEPVNKVAICAPEWHNWPQPAEVLEALLYRTPDELENWIRTYIKTGSITVITCIVVIGIAARHPDPPAILGELGKILLQKAISPSLKTLAQQAILGNFAQWQRCAPY